MKNRTLLTGLGVLVLVLLGGWYWMSSNPTPTPAATNTVVQPQGYSLALVNRTLTPNIVTVTQGDNIAITITSDEKGEFHISGYDIENFMPTPGQTNELSFVANLAGRYNFEFHPGGTPEAAANAEDIVIGAFVVNPR